MVKDSMQATKNDDFNKEEKVDFDTWYIIRQSRIPEIHHKEIIKADFKARGLDKTQSVCAFDAALAKYGVKLG